MSSAPVSSVCSDRERAEYEGAIEQLRAGQLQVGAHRLGAIAARTGDDALRSQCLHSLAQVLERLGRPEEAYRLWYGLAHKPPVRRNSYDLSARMQIMRLFDALALRVPPPDFPPRVQIEVTNRCNLRCIMCTRNQMRRPEGDLPFELFCKIADECSVNPGSVLLLFLLGEPLLHPRLAEMVAYLASVKDRTSVRRRR